MSGTLGELQKRWQKQSKYAPLEKEESNRISGGNKHKQYVDDGDDLLPPLGLIVCVALVLLNRGTTGKSVICR